MSNAKSVVLVMFDPRKISTTLNQKLQVGVTPDNILNPTAEIVQQIYLNFVRVVINISENSLHTLPLNADSDFDQELHKKSIPLAIVYQSMKAFIKDNSGGKLDLTMCDLVTPGKNPQRFRKLSSFLADFIKLDEIAAPIFNEISEEFSDQKVEMEALQEEIVAAEKRKDELVARQSQRRRRENELMDDHNKKKSELAGIINQYTEIGVKTEELEKQKNELIRQIEETEKESITAKKTVELLNEEVLASPEELRQEMTERKKQIEDLKESIITAKQALQDKLEARDICANADKNVPVIEQKIQAWAEEREDILDLMDEVDENLRKLSEMEEQLTFTTDKKSNHGKRMIEQAEMHEQLRREHLQRSEELNKNIEEITGQIAALGKNQPSVSRDIEEKRQELLALKNAYSEQLAKYRNSSRDSFNKFRKINALFNEVQRVSLEKKNAMDRAKNRLQNMLIGRLPSDYTFSTSSINDSENCDPISPIESDFSVFKN
ncbi:CRE-HIM-10 protein [Caenorhabditis remanei]|uniref:CRE-HIM-10 protein n=1 Tax=Caenorhabditis remanei TaxID=31234 RepID=E3LYU8_CAERE|nr:CRE-HIM-10 protein [Caenorhabditis remanei]